MEKRARLSGAWPIRVGLSLCCLLGLSLAGLGVVLSDALRAPRRVVGPEDLSRLSRENALKVLTMDESLLESYRGLLHSVVNATFVAAALVLICAVLCGIGIFRSRRGLSGANHSSPPSEVLPERSPSEVPESD